MSRLLPFLVVSLLSLLVQSAKAQEAPPACNAFTSAYTTGHATGSSIARQAWRSRNVAQLCSNVDLFRQAVTDMLATLILRQPPAPSEVMVCRSMGFAQGATDTVDELLNQCADQCLLEGEFLGELAAIAYCELSIALGGLGPDVFLVRGPVEVCGTAFEVGCDARFQSEAVAYRNVLNQSCAPFTRVPFLSVFLQTQNNQCAYDPIVPDDP